MCMCTITCNNKWKKKRNLAISNMQTLKRLPTLGTWTLTATLASLMAGWRGMCMGQAVAEADVLTAARTALRGLTAAASPTVAVRMSMAATQVMADGYIAVVVLMMFLIQCARIGELLTWLAWFVGGSGFCHRLLQASADIHTFATSN